MAQLVVNTLGSFLADNNARPWQPGKVDCCIVLADWAIWLGHSDPAAHLRGAYDNDEGFRAIIAAHQGAVPVVSVCVANIGGQPTSKPERGDIGVIGSTTNIHRQFGAIHDGKSWLVRMHGGFGQMTAKILAAWKI
ncbi:DUF6950 family protein [Rhizobium azibense]|uniref:DUF6950 domain-containing protein n=1 Tax=Rhizobium azibense TaxID=1136135 RepID=A0A4R3RF41_9HYPH|nr:hypothetical protein [Rhizobium azibense]TCU34173.1 hypothetical protein EV129_113158 [Rhizobium azibense]